MKIHSYSWLNSNVGDEACVPIHYYDLHGDISRIDIRQPPREGADVHIFGGGAIANRLNTSAVRRASGKKIAWGIGVTGNIKATRKMPTGLDLIGLRDCRTAAEAKVSYCPCPSAKSGLFDKRYEVEHDVVIFESSAGHSHIPPIQIAGMPRTGNCGVTMEQAVQFLASGATVLTNSYHGAYWGLLLGRKVIIVNPYSCKFLDFRFQPAVCTDTEWKDVIKSAPTYNKDQVIFDARYYNNCFHDRVRTIINHTPD